MMKVQQEEEEEAQRGGSCDGKVTALIPTSRSINHQYI